MGFEVSKWHVLTWYYLKLISTFSLQLILKLLFCQHTQSLTFLTLGKLFHAGNKGSQCPCPGPSREPTHSCRSALYTWLPAVRCFRSSRRFAFFVVGVMSVLSCPFTNQFIFPQTTFSKMKTLSLEPIFHSSPKQFTAKVVSPSGNFSQPSWNQNS